MSELHEFECPVLTSDERDYVGSNYRVSTFSGLRVVVHLETYASPTKFSVKSVACPKYQNGKCELRTDSSLAGNCIYKNLET